MEAPAGSMWDVRQCGLHAIPSLQALGRRGGERRRRDAIEPNTGQRESSGVLSFRLLERGSIDGWRI